MLQKGLKYKISFYEQTYRMIFIRLFLINILLSVGGFFLSGHFHQTVYAQQTTEKNTMKKNFLWSKNSYCNIKEREMIEKEINQALKNTPLPLSCTPSDIEKIRVLLNKWMYLNAATCSKKIQSVDIQLVKNEPYIVITEKHMISRIIFLQDQKILKKKKLHKLFQMIDKNYHRGSFITLDSIEQLRKKIENHSDFLANYPDSFLTYTIEQNTHNNNINIIFSIKKNNTLLVSSIKFSGASDENVACILPLLSISPQYYNEHWPMQSFQYTEQKIYHDIINVIKAYYQRMGYVEAVIDTPLIEYDTRTQRSAITYRILEGLRYRVHFDIKNIVLQENEAILSLVSRYQNTFFDQDIVNKINDKINQHFSQNSFCCQQNMDQNNKIINITFEDVSKNMTVSGLVYIDTNDNKTHRTYLHDFYKLYDGAPINKTQIDYNAMMHNLHYTGSDNLLFNNTGLKHFFYKDLGKFKAGSVFTMGLNGNGLHKIANFGTTKQDFFNFFLSGELLLLKGTRNSLGFNWTLGLDSIKNTKTQNIPDYIWHNSSLSLHYKSPLMHLKPYVFYDFFWEAKAIIEFQKSMFYNRNNLNSRNTFFTDDRGIASLHYIIGMRPSRHTQQLIKVSIFHDKNAISNNSATQRIIHMNKNIYDKFYKIYFHPELGYNFQYIKKQKNSIVKVIRCDVFINLLGNNYNSLMSQNECNCKIKINLFAKPVAYLKNITFLFYGGFVRSLSDRPMHHRAYFSSLGPYDLIEYQNNKEADEQKIAPEISMDIHGSQTPYDYKKNSLPKNILTFLSNTFTTNTETISFQGGIYKAGVRAVIPFHFFKTKSISTFAMVSYGVIWGIDPHLQSIAPNIVIQRPEFKPLLDYGIGVKFKAGALNISFIFMPATNGFCLRIGDIES